MITLTRASIAPGPASCTYYYVPPALRTTPELNVPAQFRSELSLAFSTAYHLKPHAVILAHIDQKPLVSYIDYETYALSLSFYQHPKSPAIDLLYSMADVVACRRLFNNNQLPQQQPQQNDNTDW